MSVEGLRVLITGAGGGIGLAGAHLFAGKGAEVAVMDLDQARVDETVAAVRAAGGNAVPVIGNLTEPGVSEAVVNQAAEKLGGLDVLWCNAGIVGPTEIEGIDPAFYDATLAINITSPIMSCAAALPHLRQSKAASIVITASTSGLVGAMSSAVYTATKFAVVGYTKSLAQRVAPDGIRVNAVCPGPVLTPLMQHMLDNGTASMTGPEYTARITGMVPMARLATPAEIAQAALWLASPKSSYVTGIALPVDGGYTAR